MEYTGLIVAAGSGSRMGLGYNKAYYRMDGKTILEKSTELFLNDPDCRQIIIVTDSDMYRKEITNEGIGKVVLVQGGASRQESVYYGLQAVICDTVLIHDGARPFLSKENLEDMKAAVAKHDAACLMVPCKDTIKVTEDGFIKETLPRNTLMAAQTPQAFRTELLLTCMSSAKQDGFEATDDCSVVERYSDIRIKVVQGSYENKKITTREDLK